MKNRKVPYGVRGTRKTEEFMALAFEESDSPGFNLILLLVVWFTELIFDVHFAVDSINGFTLLVSSIVTLEGRWGTFVADEIIIDLGESRKAFVTIDIDAV